jgi:hypothetical protein
VPARQPHHSHKPPQNGEEGCTERDEQWRMAGTGTPPVAQQFRTRKPSEPAGHQRIGGSHAQRSTAVFKTALTPRSPATMTGHEPRPRHAVVPTRIGHRARARCVSRSGDDVRIGGGSTRLGVMGVRSSARRWSAASRVAPTVGLTAPAVDAVLHSLPAFDTFTSRGSARFQPLVMARRGRRQHG